MSYLLKGSARQIGGKRYVLVYDFEALCALEAEHPDLMNGVMDASRLQSPLYLRGLIYRGLSGQVDTEAAAGRLISAGVGFEGAFVWFQEALSIAFGGEGGEPVNPAPAQPLG